MEPNPDTPWWLNCPILTCVLVKDGEQECFEVLTDYKPNPHGFIVTDRRKPKHENTYCSKQ